MPHAFSNRNPAATRIIAVLLLVQFCAATLAHACMWINGTTLEGVVDHQRSGGRSIYSGELPLPPNVDFSGDGPGIAELLEKVAAMSLTEAAALAYSGSERRELPADWPAGLSEAVRPLFSGQTAAVLTQLRALDAATPDNYYICANLAAAAELAGQDAEALQWVEKALRIKPDAHYGTEWMHAAVLRGKLALAADPDWLKTHTFSGIPVDGDVPAAFATQDGNRTLELGEIRHALTAHLIPRLLFIKEKDPIVAALLNELARVVARAGAVEDGFALLDLAARYGSDQEPALRAHWMGILAPAAKKALVRQWAVRAMIVALLSIPAVLIWRLFRWVRRRGTSGQGS